MDVHGTDEEQQVLYTQIVDALDSCSDRGGNRLMRGRVLQGPIRGPGLKSSEIELNLAARCYFSINRQPFIED